MKTETHTDTHPAATEFATYLSLSLSLSLSLYIFAEETCAASKERASRALPRLVATLRVTCIHDAG